MLGRSKFDKYVTQDERKEFLNALVGEASLIGTTVTINECRDPKDDKYLELAVSGNATHIVTGDSDLLDLNPFRKISILNPDEFLAQS